ncbi:MAG: DMT family transporter [Saccharofermentans sp.]|nr:DMT family transporter [Saccharofermentans sp.]
MSKKVLATNDKQFLNRLPVVYIGALICCFLWGSAFPFNKIGYIKFDIASNDIGTLLLFAGIRFFIAGILAILMGSILQKKFLRPSARAVPKVMLLSSFQTIGQYFFFYIGLAKTTGARASIVEGLNVFVAIIIASLIFKKERFTLNKILGSIIGFVGIIIMNSTGSGLINSSYFMGDFFIFLSTICYAFSSVVLKKFAPSENTTMLSGYQFLFGGAFLSIVGLLLGGKLVTVTSSGIAILVYLSFVSAAAYTLWSMLLSVNPVSRLTSIGFMNPVFGFILSLFLLNEGSTVGINAVIALAVICLGIYIVNHESSKAK